MVLHCVRAYCCALAATLAVVSAAAQSARPHAGATSELRSVSITPGEFGPILEVVSTRPLTPKIQVVEQPLRLVVDLSDSTVGTVRRRIPFRNEQIKSIRLNQYQIDPAVTRIVLDLSAPVQYTWDASGNRLRIRIRADQAATAKPPTVSAFTAGIQPVAVPVSVGTSGSLIETGSRVASGASITAGDQMAVLRLTRGGEVRVCPGTTVSVATSSNGHDLMLGMSKGAMETHYGVQESLDSVLTPDFRIVLPGPGEFNLAISADSKGNTCVGSLPGSTSSAVVAELLGSGTYEIKPEQQVLFRQGRIDTVETPLASCGCPASPEPVLRASVENSQVVPEDKAGEKLTLENSSDGGPTAAPPSTSPMPSSSQEAQPPDSAKPQVESPLVFSGTELAKARQHNSTPAKIPAAPTAEAAKLPLTVRPPDPLPAAVVLPPTPEPKAKKGFFGKVKGFFGAIFHWTSPEKLQISDWRLKIVDLPRRLPSLRVSRKPYCDQENLQSAI
jgi:YD repeat-containing protein